MRALILLILAVPTLLPAKWDWYDDGKNGVNWGEPVVPPSAGRPYLPARVLDPGQGRSGLQISLLETRDSGRSNIYPYNTDNRVTAFNAVTRWGLEPGGVEIGGGLDYPFLIPSMFFRYQPFGRDWPFGPFLTFEADANAMPDYHAGASLGLGLGLLEPWVAYRGGYVLDRGYSEVSAGATLHAARMVDFGGGVSLRRYDTYPYEQTARLGIRADFGNPGDPLAGELKTGGAKAEELLEQKRYKAAAQAYEDELEVYPDDAARWKGYATALEELGLTKKARLARQRAMKLEAKDGDEKKAEPEEKAEPEKGDSQIKL